MADKNELEVQSPLPTKTVPSQNELKKKQMHPKTRSVMNSALAPSRHNNEINRHLFGYYAPYVASVVAYLRIIPPLTA